MRKTKLFKNHAYDKELGSDFSAEVIVRGCMDYNYEDEEDLTEFPAWDVLIQPQGDREGLYQRREFTKKSKAMQAATKALYELYIDMQTQTTLQEVKEGQVEVEAFNKRR